MRHWHFWGRAKRHTAARQWRRQNGGLRRRWEDNIKLDLEEIRWEGVDWIGVVWWGQGEVVRCCEHGDEPSGSIQRVQFLDWL